MRTENAPTFERAISWSLDHPLPRWQRYAAATIVIGAVAIIRAELVTGLLPWLLFIPPILGVALLLGEGAGFYATALAAVLAAATIGHPSVAGFLTPPQWAGSALFLLTGACIVRVGGEVRAAFRRVRKANLSLAGREAFLSNVLASSTDCIKVLDLDGRLSFMSDGGMKVMEISDFNAATVALGQTSGKAMATLRLRRRLKRRVWGGSATSRHGATRILATRAGGTCLFLRSSA